MAVTMEAVYSKKCGLPGYSSHQYMLAVKVEIADVNQIQAESARLYQLLQNGVDSSIKEIGYLPSANGNGNGNGRAATQDKDLWNCSAPQKELIQKIVTENRLDKAKIEDLAQDRFGKGVKALNKLEASGLIEELIEQTGQKNEGRGGWFRRRQKAGAQ